MNPQQKSLFLKIKSFLTHLTLTATLLTLFLFIFSKIGFSLGLDRPQIGRLTLYLVLLTTLVNIREIKAAIDKALAPKKREKFIFYTLANVFLTLAFLVGYAIFQYGSPLVYENHPKSFKTAKEVPLVENTIISQEFKADSNNLGTVGVRLSVQEKILDFNEEGEIVEIKAEKEAAEEIVDEEFQEEPIANQGDFTQEEDKEEPFEEIANYEPAEIVFRIKEKGAGNWFYENTYYFDEPAPAHLYPFGFPVIENSKGKTYLVEIEGPKPVSPEEGNLYLFASVNKTNQPYLYSRYVYNRGELKENIGPILENVSRKICHMIIASSISIRVNIIIIFFVLELLFFIFSYTSKKELKKRGANSFLYSFLIGTLLLTVLSFISRYSQSNSHLGNIANKLSGFTFSLAFLTIVFGSLTFRTKDNNPVMGEQKKNNKKYLFLITMLLVFGFLMRLVNLGKLGYITDEGSTARYSYYINQSGLPCSDGVCYLRGLPYLYFVSVFTRIFGVNEFWVRFPGVIIGIGTIIAIVWLMKLAKINQKVILLTVFLLVFSDFHFMLSRYARMYGMMLLLMVLAFIFFIKFLETNKNKYLVASFLFVILSLLTHQFAMLLAFLPLTTFFWKKNEFFRDKRIILFAVCVFISIFLTLTKLPGYIYEEGYLGLYDLYPKRIETDKWWFLENIQIPNFVYIKDMFVFYPLVSCFPFSLIIGNLFKNKKEFLVGNFILFSFLIIALYKIDYILKYLWWILTLVIPVFSLSVYSLAKNRKLILYISILIYLAPSVVGIYHILTRNYGTNTKKFPTITPAHSENYYVDDKTPIIFLTKFYKETDIIITNYWMQDVYLELILGKKSNYFIARWDTKSYVEKFPNYKLYYDVENNNYRDSPNGPIIIYTFDEFEKIISENQRVWYISSADFTGRKHEYISNIDIESKISQLAKPLFIGNDNNSKIYLFSSSENIKQHN